jgi:hypothetical protein
MTTLVRAVVTAILSVFLVGFGLCGAYGMFGGVAVLFETSSEGRGIAPLLAIAGLVGLVIAWGCWKAIAGIWRKPGPPGP